MSKIIIGNWKLNPLTLKGAQEILKLIDREPLHEAVICPPTPFLAGLDYPNLGGQDCFWKAKGPYTGQVSPAALRSVGAMYCIVGHSERRQLGETDEEVHAKVIMLMEQGLRPIVCVGFGTTEDNDELAVTDIIKQQLDQALAGVGRLDKVIVAYEPVWAIGTGKPATPEHAEKVSIFIRTKYKVGKVLYGGSSNSTNAESFLKQNNIDGLLVGGASLLPEDFNKMINTPI